LISIASTSRSFFSKCYPHLLQNVTITVLTLTSVYLLLQREPLVGLEIQQLVVRSSEDHPAEEEASFFKLWGAPDSAAGRNLTQIEAESQALRSILGKCQNLQTLVLKYGIYLCLKGLFNGRSLPLPFLTQSLKRLFWFLPNNRNRMAQRRT